MTPQLSKSRFQYGRQCLKRLYLECRRPNAADPVDPGRQAILSAGAAVGELARRRFPGGRLIPGNYREHNQAVATTAALLADPAVPALYEAAFTSDGIRLRADILKRNGTRAFDLIEVKSAARVKAEYITDAAIQVYAVETANIPVNRACIMHINNAYTYPGGPYDMQQLFTLVDVTDPVRSFIADQMPYELARMRQTLQLDHAPDIPTGPHCQNPYRCSFYEHCHPNEPATPKPLHIGPGLRPALNQIPFPLTFLDFEAANPALPLYPNTRPYQKIPFQWSLHIRDASGNLTKKSFLNHDANDPRERLAAALLRNIPPNGAIITYSHYESEVIRDLAQKFPQHAPRLLPLLDRITDLYRLIKTHCHHPEFRGGYSLKSVLPLLIPNLNYAGLDISDGHAAAASYIRMIAPDTPQPEKAKIRQSLLAYCQRDTEAIARIYHALTTQSNA